MLLLPLLLATAPANEPAAVTLFRSACMDGSVQLKKRDIVETGLAGMPADGRAALAQSQVEVGEVRIKPPVPTPKQVPNTIYRMTGEPESYLILPVQLPGSMGYAATCAVVVRGDVSKDAETLFPDPSQVGVLFAQPPGGARRDLQYVSAPVDGRMLVVARRAGWTLVSAAPDARPARLRRK